MKTVIEMARSVGATAYTNRHYPDRPTHTFNVEQLKRFAELVRADEREACAKLCETEWSNVAERIYGEECAVAIRARGNT